MSSFCTWHRSPSRCVPLFLLLGIGVALAGCTPPSAPAVRPASSPSSLRAAPHSIPERLTLSDQQERAGETFAAIEQIEAARILGEKEEGVDLRLARLYDSIGEYEQAAAVLGQAAARPGASSDVRVAWSQALFKLGDFPGADRALQPLLSHWDRLPDETRRTIVRTLLLADDLRAARPLLSLSPQPEWLALKGTAALLDGQPAEAVHTLIQTVKADPNDGWNRYLLGWAFSAAGNKQGALTTWQAAAALPDAPGSAAIGAARILAEEGRADDAERLLKQVRKEDTETPAYWQAWNRIAQDRKQPVQEALTRGYAAFYGGDPWQAERVWQQILPQAQTDDAKELYAAIHNSAFRRHDMDVAARFADAAAARWPKDPYFLKRRAEVLLGQNRLSEALAVGNRLKRITPPDQQAEVAELLARIALDSGKPDVLQQNAQECKSLKPTDPDPVLHLAEWQAQEGRSPENLERTLALYREAAAIDPQNAEAQARAGLVLVDLKRPDEAILLLLHALTLTPRVLDGTPNAQLAMLYRQRGQMPESQFETAQYERLHRLKDDWPSLLKLLRSDGPLSAWNTLGRTALDRHETWIALCAYVRCTQKAPQDAKCWFGLAAAQKRSGWFEETLHSVQRGQQCRHIRL
ncbi:MAG TPA: tetratricopeptide repeat protein [Chthonomonadaceae bacterium]|nr:tetratricopeptide repeat protein [Chthonomonadaceae bacterium]